MFFAGVVHGVLFHVKCDSIDIAKFNEEGRQNQIRNHVKSSVVDHNVHFSFLKVPGSVKRESKGSYFKNSKNCSESSVMMLSLQFANFESKSSVLIPEEN